jgi:hypothetical protein
MKRFEIHRTLAYPRAGRPLQLLGLAIGIDSTRTLRGAVCGAVAAGVWALQQPVVRGDGWVAAGVAMHLQNGAMFGAVYANIAPAIPIPPMLRGPALALAEHVALWPLGRVSDRFHPARKELPTLTGNRRAFAQGAWRHLLFGIVLGELERRVNAVPEPAPLAPEAEYSSNGHGSLEQAVSAESA